MTDDAWIPLAEAAVRLGLEVGRVREMIQRRELRAKNVYTRGPGWLNEQMLVHTSFKPPPPRVRSEVS